LLAASIHNHGKTTRRPKESHPMRSAGWVLVPFVALACVGGVLGQVVLVPAPAPVGQTIVVGPSVGLSYKRGSLRIGGFLGSIGLGNPYGMAPYGASTSQVTINYFIPRPVLVAPPAPAEDLSGVDLDVTPPPWRPKLAPPPRRPAPAAAKPAQAAPKPAPPPKPPELPPPPPAPELESSLLVGAGEKAFAAKEYGLAAQRFHQAAVADRNSSHARFLLAQALFALGKYREAVAAIHEGMDLDLNWPRKAFRPRLDLYKGNEADFTTHLKDLEAALGRSPDNRFFLFLEGYQLWLDGRQADAIPFFQRARAVTVDTTYIDRFLRLAPGGALAAK
jgi:hypothetical protein